MNKPIRIFTKDQPTFEVCPWSYAKCDLPAGKTCQVRKKIGAAENISEWNNTVSKALSCPHRREALTRSQHFHRRMGRVV